MPLRIRIAIGALVGSAVALASSCGPGASGSGVDADVSCPATCDGTGHAPDQTWDCRLDSPCPDRVSFSSAPSLSIMGPFKLETPDAARCVLGALRDGKVGHYTWGVGAVASPGISQGADWFVRPGRIVLSQKEIDRDLSVTHVAWSGHLQAAAYYTQCLAQTDDDALYACFDQAAIQGCQ